MTDIDPHGLDEPARPVPELVELFKRHRVIPEADPLAVAHARIRELEDRVIANIDARGDAEDLRRENAELRAQLADAPTSEVAVAKLREWSASAGPGYEYGPGATHIAMSVAMARKILDEIDGLNRTLEIADENCSCMAVIAARATVDNEEVGQS